MKLLFNFTIKLFYVIVMPIIATLLCYSIVLNYSVNAYELVGMILFVISSFIAAIVINNKIKSVKLKPTFKVEMAMSLSIGILFHESEIVILIPFVILRIKPKSKRYEKNYYE